MTDGTDRPAKRGEAKWKQVREAVAASNQAARKASRQKREEFERRRDEVVRAAERARRPGGRSRS